jgi:hypothetical protein
VTAIIADKKDALEINRYKNELQKLKNFLLDKLEEYPEIAKEISNDLNIVTKEISSTCKRNNGRNKCISRPTTARIRSVRSCSTAY